MRYGTVKITRPDWWPGALQQHAMADRFEAAFFTEDDNTISCGWLSILVLFLVRSRQARYDGLVADWLPMKRTFLIRTLLVLAIVLSSFLVWFKARYGGSIFPFPDLTTAPALPAGRLEVVATLNEAPGNIAVSPDGRIFFSFHPEGHPNIRVAELVDGKPRPFPSVEFAHLDILLEAQYPHLECLPQNRKKVSNCCRAHWTC